MSASSTKDIRNRIRSVESTMHITKAMELVASSKLRRAKLHAEQTRPYFLTLHQTLSDIAANNRDFSSDYAKPREVRCTGYVLIAGDRGLAGGYNANLFRSFEEHRAGAPCVVLPIGKRAVEYAHRRGLPILTEAYAEAAGVNLGRCSEIGRILCAAFNEGAFDKLYVVYTEFVSMLSQQPRAMSLLPLEHSEAAPTGKPRADLLYEPSPQAVYDAIVPAYLAGLVYGAMAESIASEQGARRTAMDAASKNAGEMIDTLSLQYNRARQAAITQEITEIVAGAEH